MRALFFLLLHRLASKLDCNQFARDSHRKSGVLSFLALLSPVDSCNPPELKELTIRLYAQGMRGASEKKKKIEAEGISRILSALTCGFLTSANPLGVRHRHPISLCSFRPGNSQTEGM